MGKLHVWKLIHWGCLAIHMLNYALFDVIIELVYFWIKTKHFGPYWHICTSAYILYHSRANNDTDNSSKWQKLHIWKTNFRTMISIVTNGSQWMLVFNPYWTGRTYVHPWLRDWKDIYVHPWLRDWKDIYVHPWLRYWKDIYVHPWFRDWKDIYIPLL